MNVVEMNGEEEEFNNPEVNNETTKQERLAPFRLSLLFLSLFIPVNLLLLSNSTGLESGLRPLDGKIPECAISDISFFQFSPEQNLIHVIIATVSTWFFCISI